MKSQLKVQDDKDKNNVNDDGISSFSFEIRGFRNVGRIMRTGLGLGVVLILSTSYNLELDDTLRILGAYGAGAFSLYSPGNKDKRSDNER